MSKIVLSVLLVFALFVNAQQTFAVENTLTKEDIPKEMLEYFTKTAENLPVDSEIRFLYNNVQPIVVVFVGKKLMALVFCGVNGWEVIPLDVVEYNKLNKKNGKSFLDFMSDEFNLPDASEIHGSMRVDRFM